MKKALNVCLLFFCSSLMAQNPPQLNPLNPPSDPVGNPTTADKVMLGKVLFWDEQLSSSKTVACATCHILSSGGTDLRSSKNNIKAINPGLDQSFLTVDDIVGSPGVPQSCDQGNYSYSDVYGYEAQSTNRKSPPVINASLFTSLFWDGRAGGQFIDPLTNEQILNSNASLENQVLGPPTSAIEMAHSGRNWEDVIADLEKSSPLALSPVPTAELSSWIADNSYFELFNRVFGSTEITVSRIAMAIASYERSLFSNQTPFDEFIAGNTNALTQQERTGFNVFRQAGCAACHTGSLLSDNQFHNIGVTPNAEDSGRFTVTTSNRDQGRFKTPGLRNISLQNTFMHNGGLTSIEEVIEFYDRGGDVNNPNLDNRIRPLNLNNQQKIDLAAFLKRPLTDPRVSSGIAPFTSPLLFSESDRVPTQSGTGIAGSNLKTPVAVAIEPSILGNNSFTVAVENTLPSSEAFFVINTQDPGISGLPIAEEMLIFSHVQTKNSNNDGIASLSVTLPTNEEMNGTTLFARWYIQDENAVNNYAISPLIQFTLFKPEHGTAGKIFGGGFEEVLTNCN